MQHPATLPRTELKRRVRLTPDKSRYWTSGFDPISLVRLGRLSGTGRRAGFLSSVIFRASGSSVVFLIVCKTEQMIEPA